MTKRQIDGVTYALHPGESTCAGCIAQDNGDLCEKLGAGCIVEGGVWSFESAEYPKGLRELAENFQITGPDADGLVWLVLHGNGTSGKAMFNLGNANSIATQVALLLEQDRLAALGLSA